MMIKLLGFVLIFVGCNLSDEFNPDKRSNNTSENSRTLPLPKNNSLNNNPITNSVPENNENNQEQCGNDLLDDFELCDGSNLNGKTCSSFGYDGGELSCSSACTFDFEKCSTCGNRRREENEVCDSDTRACSLSQSGYGGEEHCAENCEGYIRDDCFPQFKSIEAGAHHYCGHLLDGTLKCWGRVDSGQTFPPSGVFGKISLNVGFGCGLREDGIAQCWGESSSSDRHNVAPPGIKFTDIAVGTRAACGMKTTGETICWGVGTVGNQTAIPGNVFVQLVAGHSHVCGLTESGVAKCWGSNTNGESTPPNQTFEMLSSGPGVTCGLKQGVVTCWGGDIGQPPLGLSLISNTGGFFYCGLDNQGMVHCWGTQIPEPPQTSFTSIAVAWQSVCGIDADKRVHCWGFEISDPE